MQQSFDVIVYMVNI